MRHLPLKIATLGAALVLAACTGSWSDGGGLCNLMGPCASSGYPSGPVEYAGIIGFPSNDNPDHFLRLSAGDTVSLYYVRYRGDSACVAADTIRSTATWGVSDSSVASITPMGNGRALLRIKRTGTTEVHYHAGTVKLVPGATWQFLLGCPRGEQVRDLRIDK